MAKMSGTRTEGGLVKLKKVVVRVHQTLLTVTKSTTPIVGINVPPVDVKKGHFAVIAAAAHDQPKRFILPLSYLTQPSFVKLLEMAAEEYGFNRDGALTVPCPPGDIERILAEEGGFRRQVWAW